MSGEYWAAAIMAGLLTCYLLYALVRAERF
jgi:K+-transporting ATPase KdpF subunit